ncbi:hypothetical protein F5Y16DRAFT_327734 [Xylariaceae sp. FL0255]|nr:hypothetical protein F5Y16DRAFT_327734 [Xylariaceae sp. FL0255]
MARPNHGKFEFVMSAPNEKLSKENHSKIRRHVTRAVLEARRKSGTCATARKLQPVVRSIPLSGLEVLAADCGLNPLDLSALASIHLGPVAAASLHADPSQLRRILSCQQASYFSFIPARFSEVPVLEDAYRCLITVAHSLLVPTKKTNNKTILGYYGKSLRSLQNAVDDPTSRHTAETLCAIGILALFEILNSSEGNLWGRHMRGASRLIQSRGPDSFTTEFDLALLVLLGPPMCAECLGSGRAVFLDDPAWREVLLDAIYPGNPFGVRSALAISVLITMSKVPGLAKRTEEAIIANDRGELVDFDLLVKDLHSVRTETLAWRRNFNITLINNVDTARVEQGCNPDKRFELLGMTLVFHIIATRMLVCISPRERRLLEEEVQNVSMELKQLHQSVDYVGTTNSRAGFFLAQKATVADIAIETNSVINGYDETGIVDLMTFRQWWRERDAY